ncbi:hypothetical protein MTO96_019585 [Rhipicephalus appendiculatus]
MARTREQQQQQWRRCGMRDCKGSLGHIRGHASRRARSGKPAFLLSRSRLLMTCPPLSRSGCARSCSTSAAAAAKVADMRRPKRGSGNSEEKGMRANGRRSQLPQPSTKAAARSVVENSAQVRVTTGRLLFRRMDRRTPVTIEPYS